MRRALSLSIVVGLALVGCGGSSTSDAATGGTAGTSGTGGTGGTAGGGGAGGATGCSAFADAPAPPGGMTIRLENARTAPIYLGGGANCAPAPLYSLEGPTGALALDASNCGSTCQDLQQHGTYCTGGCQQPLGVRIDPGGHYDASWSGVTYQPETMPASCYWDPGSATASCDRQILPDAGSYSALASAATGVTCSNATCSCTPDASGSCQIQGATLSGTKLSAKASFDYPTSLVTVIFQ